MAMPAVRRTRLPSSWKGDLLKSAYALPWLIMFTTALQSRGPWLSKPRVLKSPPVYLHPDKNLNTAARSA